MVQEKIIDERLSYLSKLREGPMTKKIATNTNADNKANKLCMSSSADYYSLKYHYESRSFAWF